MNQHPANTYNAENQSPNSKLHVQHTQHRQYWPDVSPTPTPRSCISRSCLSISPTASFILPYSAKPSKARPRRTRGLSGLSRLSKDTLVSCPPSADSAENSPSPPSPSPPPQPLPPQSPDSFALDDGFPLIKAVIEPLSTASTASYRKYKPRGHSKHFDSDRSVFAFDSLQRHRAHLSATTVTSAALTMKKSKSDRSYLMSTHHEVDRFDSARSSFDSFTQQMKVKHKGRPQTARQPRLPRHHRGSRRRRKHFKSHSDEVIPCTRACTAAEKPTKSRRSKKKVHFNDVAMDYMSPQQQLLYLYDYYAAKHSQHSKDDTASLTTTHTVTNTDTRTKSTRSHSITAMPLPVCVTPAPPAELDSVSTISSRSQQALSVVGLNSVRVSGRSERTPSYRSKKHNRHSSLDFLSSPGVSTRAMRNSPAAHHKERVVHIASRNASPRYLFNDGCAAMDCAAITPFERRRSVSVSANVSRLDDADCAAITPFARDRVDRVDSRMSVSSNVDDAQLLRVPDAYEMQAMPEGEVSDLPLSDEDEDVGSPETDVEDAESPIYRLLLNDRELRSHGLQLSDAECQSENENVSLLCPSQEVSREWPCAPVVQRLSMERSLTRLQCCV